MLRVTLEERPGLVGEVDVLIRLAETLPETGPSLRRVRPAVPHPHRLVLPELPAVRPRPVALSFDRAARATCVGLVGIALNDVGKHIDLGRAHQAHRGHPGVARLFHARVGGVGVLARASWPGFLAGRR